MAKTGAKGMPHSTYDTWLLLPVFFMVGIGLIMIYSASSAIAVQVKNAESGYYFLKKQAIFAAAGGFVLIICKNLPYRLFEKLAYLPIITAMFLLAATQIPGIGLTAGGAQRWINLAGFTLQPSELARIALVIYLAYSLSKKQENIKSFAIGFAPHVIVVLIMACLLLLQPDFGSVVILFTITWLMMFAGGVRLKHLTVSLIPLLPVAAVIMYSASYRVQRLMSFRDPWKYATGEGYQITHSLMAFGSGGLFGKGLGQSFQKLFYLPEPHTDFIFSVIGEELGLAGVLLIILLYAVIVWRGFSISRHADTLFGSLMATGISTALALQVCLNMGVTMGILPTKGLALPFLSYGGSSLVINMAAMGILMNIGRSRVK